MLSTGILSIKKGGLRHTDDSQATGWKRPMFFAYAVRSKISPLPAI